MEQSGALAGRVPALEGFLNRTLLSVDECNGDFSPMITLPTVSSLSLGPF
jgi:hypothetical protein